MSRLKLFLVILFGLVYIPAHAYAQTPEGWQYPPPLPTVESGNKPAADYQPGQSYPGPNAQGLQPPNSLPSVPTPQNIPAPPASMPPQPQPAAPATIPSSAAEYQKPVRPTQPSVEKRIEASPPAQEKVLQATATATPGQSETSSQESEALPPANENLVSAQSSRQTAIVPIGSIIIIFAVASAGYIYLKRYKLAANKKT